MQAITFSSAYFDDCRLLEVNGVSVINQTQEDVVSALRSIAIGSVVNLTISRQNENLHRKIVSLP